MNKFLFGGAAAIALVAGSAVLAQTAPQPAPAGPRAHKMMQTENRTDVRAPAARMFARLDTNPDGFVTKAEIDAGQSQREAKWHERAEKRAQRFDPDKI